MRIRNSWFMGLLLAASVPAALTASAGEEHAKLESIPAAARATILKEANGAPVIDVEVETKGGKKLYEAHVKRGSDVIGILVDEKGTLMGKHSEKDEHKEHK